MIGHNISVDIHRRMRSHSRSISLENVRPYHMDGGEESDNDEFSFHELRSLERPVTDLQETMHLQSPLRNGEVKRTPDHHHEASASQLSDAYTMSAASALDVTPHERNLSTVHEQQTSLSSTALESSATRLLEEQQHSHQGFMSNQYSDNSSKNSLKLPFLPMEYRNTTACHCCYYK